MYVELLDEMGHDSGNDRDAVLPLEHGKGKNIFKNYTRFKNCFLMGVEEIKKLMEFCE